MLPCPRVRFERQNRRPVSAWAALYLTCIAVFLATTPVFASTGVTGTVEHLLEPSPVLEFNDYTGHAVATDGEWMVAGAIGDDGGYVPVYHLTATGWEHYQDLTPSDAGLSTAADVFGASVAIEGDVIVVGGWFPIYDSKTGELLTELGGAYVYRLDSGTWVEQQKLEPNGVDISGLGYGFSVSVSSGLAAVGANTTAFGADDGAVFLFRDNLGTWTHIDTIEQPVNSESFARRLAQEGSRIVATAPHDFAGIQTGRAYVYDFDPISDTWLLTAELTSLGNDDGEEFGNSVAADGDVIVIGSSVEDTSVGVGTGSAYVFRDSGSGPVLEAILEPILATLPPSGNLGFGLSVSVRGNTIAVGATFDETAGAYASGAAFLYHRSDDAWTTGGRIENPELLPEGDLFGIGTALTDNGVFIGVSGDDYYAQFAGSVWFVEIGYTCYGILATIVGTELDDTIDGTLGNDIIVGLGGRDIITGLWGTDVICGGDGTDELWGGAHDDIILGEGGDDTIYGVGDGDIIWGGSGDDIIDGGDATDEIHGGPGSDVLVCGGGHDEAWGDAGGDEIYGDDGDDSIHGGDGRDWIEGGAGNDSLYGDLHDDRLYGEAGMDTLNGGAGSDICNGGTEVDSGSGCESSVSIP